MKNTIEVDFKISDKVIIIELKLSGRITAIFINNKGITYYVEYFYNGVRQSCYCYADELQLK